MLFIDENHNKWSIHTLRKIRTNYHHLRKFAETEQIEIEFSRIDRNFLEQYIRFLRIKYNHSNNTISKNLDVLKWFLNWATTRGYNKSLL
jgi:site-specific recombinase XerD